MQRRISLVTHNSAFPNTLQWNWIFTAVYWETHLSAPIFCPKEKVVFSEQDWSFLRTKLSFPSDEIMGLHKWERMAH